MGKACLSLGSNQSPEANLRSAFAALRARFGGIVASVVYRFPAVGFDGPDFLNAAAVIESDLDPFALNDWLHALEDAHGRDRSGPRFGDRPLDIDIVFYDDLMLEGTGHPGSSPAQVLQLPRDELKHAFVLKPLAEIAPDFVDPRSGRTLAALWAGSPERDVPFVPAFDPNVGE
ncbi:MAG: 2-amino-4-hydroxy-6-hydroxymethyldihydropteridine diphosphokinase [Lysobacter sp.]|nr:2-amino-4-hydroxy-6-hydroxymethyldihydropteridine diphosphokinase [Lysobacter sp.]